MSGFHAYKEYGIKYWKNIIINKDIKIYNPQKILYFFINKVTIKIS